METSLARQQLAELELRAFGRGEAIDLGAVISMESDAGAEVYFLAPRAGGMEVTQGKLTVSVITPQSPFGRQLLGRKAGDHVSIELAGTRRKFLIAAVE